MIYIELARNEWNLHIQMQTLPFSLQTDADEQMNGATFSNHRINTQRKAHNDKMKYERIQKKNTKLRYAESDRPS